MAGPVVMLDKDCGVQGKLQYTKSRDKPVYTYLGVPYAEPPVGTRRFKPTAPLKLWNGIRDASKHGASCPQESSFNTKALPRHPEIKEMSEDCLFVNVYTPKPPLDKENRVTNIDSLPVMVWIHGGALYFGSSNSYDGTVLAAQHNVIVVTINYRLNIFGFLATPDGFIGGNMGLMDQVEALKWVQKYIQKFGGDPTNVTIFGESAGGMSAGLLMISPLSRGLFKRVICESGTPLFGGMIASERRNTDSLKTRFQSFDVDFTNGRELENFLQNMDSVEIISNFFGDYRPIVDGNFLPENPLSLFKKEQFGKVDLMAGFTSDEADLLLNVLFKRAPDFKWDKESSYDMADEYLCAWIMPEHPNKAAIIAQMQERYFNKCSEAESYHKKVFQLMSDSLFEAPTILLANILASQNRTYLYEFQHRPCFSTLPSWAFANHIDEIPYVFGEPYNPFFKDQWTADDRDVSNMMMTYWSNFAKTGDPNGHDVPEWPRYGLDQQKYIVLKRQPEICNKRKPEKMDLWNHVFQEHQ